VEVSRFVRLYEYLAPVPSSIAFPRKLFEIKESFQLEKNICFYRRRRPLSRRRMAGFYISFA
jgi:hypothetical protein